MQSRAGTADTGFRLVGLTETLVTIGWAPDSVSR